MTPLHYDPSSLEACLLLSNMFDLVILCYTIGNYKTLYIYICVCVYDMHHPWWWNDDDPIDRIAGSRMWSLLSRGALLQVLQHPLTLDQVPPRRRMTGNQESQRFKCYMHMLQVCKWYLMILNDHISTLITPGRCRCIWSVGCLVGWLVICATHY